MAEFHAAEQLGAVLGQREREQQGDAYRLLAQRELSIAPQTAWQDAQMARQMYEQVRGFDRVDQSLAELENVHGAAGAGEASRSAAQEARMAVTRSWTARPMVLRVAQPAAPRSEIGWLLVASLIRGGGSGHGVLGESGMLSAARRNWST